MQEHGLVAIVKRDCPTCVLVTPVLQEILQRSDLKIYTQDDPGFPEGIDGVADDTSLDASYRLGVDIVPTLERVATLLDERGIAVNRYCKPTPGRTAPKEIEQAIVEEVDIVVEGLAD